VAASAETSSASIAESVTFRPFRLARLPLKRVTDPADERGMEHPGVEIAPRSTTVPRFRVRNATLVGLVVTISAAVRIIAGGAKSTPGFFPDEYRFMSLAHSLAETGRPLVRGADTHFPALLQPLLTAPVWMLTDNTQAVYAAIKLQGAVVMSLAAIPVFLLALRLGQQRSAALLCSVTAVAVPEMLYSSWVFAEPYAYPLVLGAVAAGSIALGGGSAKARVAFLVLAGAAALARAQFVAVPLCFAVATVVVGLRRRALLAELRRQALVLGAFVLPLLAVLLLAPNAMGFYKDFNHVDLDPGWLSGRLGTNGFILLFAVGWVVVPGALFGMGLAVARPRSQIELGFGTLAGLLTVALLLEACVYGDVDRAQARYFFYLVPLVALHFCLYASRGWPHARAYSVVALSGVVLSALVPVTGYAAGLLKTQSVVLLGVARVEEMIGVGTGALVVALVACAASLLAAALPWIGRYGATVGLVATIGLLVAAGALAASFDVRNTDRMLMAYLPADNPNWVDDEQLGDVTLLHVAASRADTLTQLFWNRSVTRVAVVPGGEAPDFFATQATAIDKTGAVRVEGRPLLGAVLADSDASVMTFQSGRIVAGSPAYKLWRLDGPARLGLYGLGWYQDGWLSSRSSLVLWPQVGQTALVGTVSMRLEAPVSFTRSVPITISWAGGHKTVDVGAGASVNVSVPVCSIGQWLARITTTRPTQLGSRSVSLFATRPVFRPDAASCANTTS
jgi:hypothetical protein